MHVIGKDWTSVVLLFFLSSLPAFYLSFLSYYLLEITLIIQMKGIFSLISLIAIAVAVASAKRESLAAGMVHTPAGPYPKECVHSGTLFYFFLFLFISFISMVRSDGLNGA